MITREFTGKDEKEVIAKALDTLKLREDQVKIEKETKGGFLGLGAKEVVVKVSFDDDLQFGNRAIMYIKDLLEKMDIEAKIYLVEDNDERVLIEIESPDSAMIIGRQGKNLEAIQTIVNVALNRDAEVWTKVAIDIGNYRYRKERQLKRTALQAAGHVRRTKRSVVLDPMNPFERRIIHMTLKQEPNVITESEGDGLIKSIKVSYSDGKEAGTDAAEETN